MTYTRVLITASGIDFDNSTPTGQAIDILAYTTAPVTLLGNVIINPTIAVGTETSFSLRWEANLTLSTFSVVVVGVTFPQDQVNQTGTFSCYYDGANWSVQYFADGKDQPQAAQGVTNAPVIVGGTLTLTAGVDAAYQRLTGPITLTSAYTVTANTGVKAGSQFQIEIAGPITLNGNALTVFGISINANQAFNGGVIILATFDGTNWIGVSTSAPVSTADIVPVVARTVMGNASASTAAPTDIAFPTDYGVLQRNGTTLTTGLLTASNFSSGIAAMQVAFTRLTNTQIASSNTNPIQILSAATNYNIIHKVIVLTTYSGTVYTGNLDAIIYFNGSGGNLLVAPGLWGFTSTGGYSFFEYQPVTSILQTPKQQPLYISTDGGNPAAGNSSVEILVYYTAY